MADHDIFREQLAIMYPTYGHALWDPTPMRPDIPVKIGDVGLIRWGKFHRLFNALLPANDPSHELGVPEDYEPLVLNYHGPVNACFLSRGYYSSAEVSVEPTPDFRASPSDDFQHVSFACPRRRKGAVLCLPVKARREDTPAQGDFGKWMLRNIDRWFAFARRLGLGIERMEEIILVTGCDRTRSWTNIAFLGGQAHARASLAVKVGSGDNPSINFRFSPEHVQGAVLKEGPEGTGRPDDQCIFIRGFRAARTLKKFHTHLKAAADYHNLESDCEPDTELMSFSESSKYQDPLHILLDHIAERSSDCDMVLVHDNDLQKITGIGDNTSLETLQPDVMVDLLRRSDLEIHNVSCDLSHTSSSPNPGSNVVRVAMLSMIFQNGDVASSPSQLSDSSPVPVPVVRNGNVISSFATAKDALRIAGIPLADAPPLGHPMATHRMRGIKSLTITPHDTPVQQPPFDRNHHCPPHNGSTHSSYGAYDWGLCSAMPEPQRGIGYDAFMRQPPLGRSLVSASARSYNVPGSRYLHPLDHAHQQNPAAVIARGSQYQGLVSSQNTAGGSYLTSRQIVVSSETSPPMAEYSDPWGLPPYERFWKPEQPMPTPQSFSLCTRKKRALVIGINYTHSNPDLQLRHAVEDAYSIANFLCENLGFAQDDVRLMTDDRPWDQPDKESIMRAMNELVYDAQPHDSLFCYFSGHGSQTKDVTGVELDGLSESMCAVDYVGGEQWQGRNANTSGFIVGDIKVPTGYGYETDGPIAYLGGEHVQDRNVNAPGLILDDLIHDLMVRPLPSRCRLTVVSDSCHSGTLLDLPYIYDSNGGVKELGHPYRRQRSSHADIVSLSVGHDHRESFETNLGGALRSAFIDCMGRCRNGVTYKQLMESIQNHAKGYKFPQEPQLSSSLKLDTNRLFFI